MGFARRASYKFGQDVANAYSRNRRSNRPNGNDPENGGCCGCLMFIVIGIIFMIIVSKCSS